MPIYRYHALDSHGKKIEGIIDADCVSMAKERLKKQRIIVTKLDGEASSSTISKLPSSHLLTFTRDLANLLQSGLPLYETLLTIEEKARGQKEHRLFLDLCDQVKQGRQFSNVLAEYPRIFDSVYVAMVTAGEETGALAEVFFQLAKMLHRQQKLKKQMRSAMTYPAFLLGFCFVVVTALLLFVIPSMRELMEGRKLHPLTETILNISNFLSFHKNGVFLSVVFFILPIVFFLKSIQGKYFLKKISLHTPILKKLITQSVLIRFSRTLGVLLSQGVPLTTGLQLAKRVMNHASFESVVQRAEQGVIEGKKLSQELSYGSLFPSMMIRMIATAEEVGKVDQMLLHVSEIYEEDLEKSLQQFTSLLQPVMLLVLGLIVGVILLSVLLPLTDVSSFL